MGSRDSVTVGCTFVVQITRQSIGSGQISLSVNKLTVEVDPNQAVTSKIILKSNLM